LLLPTDREVSRRSPNTNIARQDTTNRRHGGPTTSGTRFNRNDETATAPIAPPGRIPYWEYFNFPGHGFDGENSPSDCLFT